MALGSGQKISKIVDDFTSIDLQIAKGRAGPLFVCRETDTMCILTAHLKAYTRENMKVEINEDGARIAISGERPVQETVMVTREAYKKEIKMRGFRKAFKIPEGVILDKIKAGFDEGESVLTISMPKLVRGIRGIRVEEVKEEEAARGSFKSLQITASGVAERETLQQEKHGQELDQIETWRLKQFTDQDQGRKDQQVEEGKEEIQKKEKGIEEVSGTLSLVKPADEEKVHEGEQPPGTEKEKSLGDQSTQASSLPEKRSKLCVPIMAGSTFLVSIVWLVIHLIRTKNPPSIKKH